MGKTLGYPKGRLWQLIIFLAIFFICFPAPIQAAEDYDFFESSIVVGEAAIDYNLFFDSPEIAISIMNDEFSRGAETVYLFILGKHTQYYDLFSGESVARSIVKEKVTYLVDVSGNIIPIVGSKVADLDYSAIWNETRETWYIKVSVPGEELDVDSVETINVIKEAGVDLAEPRVLTPDTDKVLWFAVAGRDGELNLKGDGEYAYEVVRIDGSKYIFNFTYANNQVQGVEAVPIVIDRQDNEVTQDPGITGGSSLEYSFDAETSTLTIDANGATLPYYVQAGTTPPRGANWVGVAIPVPEGVDTEEVTASINGKDCTDLYFAEGKYMEYIDVQSTGDSTYSLVINWGAGYALETITINLKNVGALAGAPVVRQDNEVTQDPGITGGSSLEYSFDAETSTLTIDANGATLPYYVQAGTTPPRGANWVGVAIPVPEGVDTEEVTASINGKDCTDLYFAEGKYMEYIDVQSTGDSTYSLVINWGAGYALETITINLKNVGALAGAPVVRQDNEVTQDPGITGGSSLEYSFDAETSTLTIDANGATLPYYVQAGTTPPRGANWVGVAIPVPEGVDTEEVTASINGKDCTDLYFAEGKYMEYIDVQSTGDSTYSLVINWGAGYALETITINLKNVGGLEVPEIVRTADSVTQDPGNTGGNLSYVFEPNAKILIISDGEVPYVEAAEGFPPTGGNWVGIAIKAPEGFSGDIKSLEIDGTVYSQPILSAEEQARGELWYYFDAKVKAESVVVITWSDAYKAETITIKTNNLTFEAAPPVEVVRDADSVTQDPGNTGGSEIEYSFDAETKTLTISDGEVPYVSGTDQTPYPGNWIGVAIKAPEGFSGDIKSLEIDGKEYSHPILSAEEQVRGELWYYFDAAKGASHTLVIEWSDAYVEETITIVTSGLTLEAAPPVEVVRDADSVTQDPGNTGGSEIEYNFDAETKTLTISDGEVPYVSGTDQTPYPGNWIGVAIKAPEGFSGDIKSLEIDGKEYSQPILSAEEQARGELWYYFDAKVKAESVVVITWSDAYKAETITIKTNNLTFEAAPPVEVVRDADSVTQDPGNTGGSEIEYSFDAETKTLTISDGEVPYVSGTDQTPYPGNWIGVAIKAPEGFSGDIKSLEIDGKEYSQPILSAEEQVRGELWYYFDAAKGASHTLVIEWSDAYVEETITIVTSGLTLEAAPPVEVVRDADSVTQDPGNTGGSEIEYNFDAETKTLTISDGEVPYVSGTDQTPYPGNWIGVAIKAPEGFSGDIKSLEIDGKEYSHPILSAEEQVRGELWYYFDAAKGASHTLVIEWSDAYVEETITIVTSGLTLEAAPPVEVVRDADSVTQDPGNTGGSEIEYNFDAETKTLTISDGEVPYVSGTDQTPYPGNWIGVAIKAPEGFSGDIKSLEIDGKEYSQPILSAEEQARGELWYYFDAKVKAESVVVITWSDAYKAETITIKTNNLTFEAAPPVEVVRDADSVTQDPGNTGGSEIEYSFDAETKTLTISDGEVPYVSGTDQTPYPGNWIGVAIKAPEGFSGDIKSLEIDGKEYSHPILSAEEQVRGELWYYFDAAKGASHTLVIEWSDAYVEETITIVTSGLTLEAAPPVEVVRDADSVTQDPGNTGGSEIEYNFDAETKTLTISDGEVPYVSGTDQTPYPGNWIGVAIKAPEGFSGDIKSLEIDGKEYSQPILSAEEQARGELWYYFDAKVKAESVVVITWSDAYKAETITIKTNNLTFEAAPPVEVVRDADSVTQDPGNTGGSEIEYSFDAETKTLTISDGEVPYVSGTDQTPYPGNWIGVAIKAPEGFSGDIKSLEIDGKEYSQPILSAEEQVRGELWYYFDAAKGASHTLVIEWSDAYVEETITIVTSGLTLEAAPPVEVVRDADSVTQDPGNTGGSEIEYNFDAETKTLTISDGEVPYVSGTDQTPYPGNWIGVAIKAPEGFSGDIKSLEIDGKEYSQPILSAEEQARGELWYYFDAKVKAESVVVITWSDAYKAETITIKTNNLTFEAAPPVEVVRDADSVTQDPGNTGGSEIEYSFDAETKTLTISDGEVPYVSGTDQTPYPGNWIGVAIKAPEGFSGDIKSLEIDGKEYSHPILSAEEQVRGELWYYFDAAKGASHTLVIEWSDAYVEETITIVTSGLTLEAAPPVEVVRDADSVTQDPGNTGGSEIEYNFDAETKTLTISDGEVPYVSGTDQTPYPGNWIGVAIKAPEGFSGDIKSLEIDGKEYSQPILSAEEQVRGELWYYFDAAKGASHTLVIEWSDAYVEETITIVTSGLTLEAAPPVEVVRDADSVTQDPGNTGGSEIEYNFDAETKTLTISDGEVPYVSGTDQTPYPGNWIGVAIKAPEGFSGDIKSLEIDGKEYSQPILSAEEQARGELWYYFDAKVKAESVVVITWSDAYKAETITIKTNNLTFEAAPPVEVVRDADSVTQDPGNTGGSEIEYSFDAETKTLTISDGEVPYVSGTDQTPYPGNWIGVAIKAPEGFSGDIKSLEIDGKEYSHPILSAEEQVRGELWYYFDAAKGASHTLVIEWSDAYVEETITIVTSGLTLEAAPPVEVVRDADSVTQDPGNTGGSEIEYNFDAETKTLTISDGEVPYVSGTDQTPYPGNWIGVAIKAPEGFSGDIKSLEIDGKEYSQPILSAEEQARGELWYYFDAKVKAESVVVITWSDAYKAETITIKTNNLTFEAAPPVEVVRDADSVTQDPGNTGGSEIEYSFDAETKTLTISDGEVPYVSGTDQTPYPGNWIGVAIKAPEGFSGDIKSLEIDGKEYSQPILSAEEQVRGELWYYFDAAKGASHTLVIEWSDAYVEETITIVTSGLTLEAAPPVEVVRDADSVTQDPGNTGGSEIEYNFDAETKTLTISDGEVPYVSGTDQTPYPGNWIGVAIKAPEGFSGDIKSLEIDGKEYSQPILSAEEQARGELWYYFDAKVKAESVVVITWSDAYKAETITIKTNNLTFEAAPPVEVVRDADSVTQDPGNTGGSEIEYSFDAETKTLTISDGEVPYVSGTDQTPYPGNWIGVAIKAPEGFSGDIKSLEIDGKEYSHPILSAEEQVRGELWYYFDAAKGASHTLVIEWSDAYVEETITIVTSGLTLEAAPPVEVVRDADSVTQDPGNTGGSEIEYNFDAETKTLTISDGEVPYVSGTDQTPYPGNWIGVAIKAPEGFSGDIKSLEIDGKEYSQPILSAEEQARGELWYYFDAAKGASHTLVIEWSDAYVEETITIVTSGLTLEAAPPVEVVRDADSVTQDPGSTGGSSLEYSFVGSSKTLTIDAKGATLPYYVQAGTTPPRGANWVGVAIVVPEDVDTSKVTASINGKECTGLYFADGKYMEYLDVQSTGDSTYEWVINWGAGYALETITINLNNVGALAGAPVVTKSIVERDPGNTGGANAIFDATTNTFSGTIDYYEAADGFPPVAGNYVGVKITAPEGVEVDPINATFTYTNQDGDEVTLIGAEWLDGDNYLYYYPKVTQERMIFEVRIDWDGIGNVYAEETIVITIAQDAILQPAPQKVLAAGAMNFDPNKVGEGIVEVTSDGEVTITLPTILEKAGYGVTEGRLNLNGKDFNYTDANGNSSQGWENPELAYVPVLVDVSQLGEYSEVTGVSYNGASGAVIELDGKLYVNIPVAKNNADPASSATVENWSLLESEETVVVITAKNAAGVEREFTFTATTEEDVVKPDAIILAAGAMNFDPNKVGEGIVEVTSDGKVTITVPTILEKAGYGVTEGRLNLNGKDFNYTDANGNSSQGWENPELAYVPVLVDVSQLGEYSEVTGVSYNGASGAVIELDGKLYVNIPVAKNNADPASSATVENWSLLESEETVVVITAKNAAGVEREFTFTATTEEDVVKPDAIILAAGAMNFDPNKVGEGIVEVTSDGEVTITLPTILEKAGYGVTEGRLNLNGKDFNYTDANGNSSQGWEKPERAYVPVLVDVSQLGEYSEVTGVSYNGASGAVIELDGKLYVNIPVAKNNADPASSATVENWSLLESEETVVVITAKNAAGVEREFTFTATTEEDVVKPDAIILAAGAMNFDPNKVGEGIVEVTSDGEVTITLPTILEKAGYGVTEGRLNLNGKDFNYTDANGNSSQGWENPELAYVPVLVDVSQLGEYSEVTGVSYNGASGAVIELDGKLYVNIPVAKNNADPASSATVENWSLLESEETVVVITAKNAAGVEREFTFTATTEEDVVKPDAIILAAGAMNFDPNKVGEGIVEVTSDGKVTITVPTILEKAGYGVTEGRLNLNGKDFNYTDANGNSSQGWENPELAYVPVLVDVSQLGEYSEVTGVSYNGASGAVIELDGKLYVNIPVAKNNADPASSATVENWSLLESEETVVVITAKNAAGVEREFTFTATTEERIVLDSTITQDPGKTGGDNATVAIDGKTITFGGEIEYYEEAAGFPPVAGNYVGVEVKAPTGITPGAATTLILEGRDPIVGWDNFKDGDNFFWYYPRVTEAGQEFTVVVKWDGTDETADTFTIKIAADAVLKGGPAEPMEITANVPTFRVNVPATFTVGTIANSDAGKMVRAHFALPPQATIEYQEGGVGEWIPLVDVFGPETGFPLGDITTTFRGTFSEAGTYTVTVEFRTVDGNELLGSKDIIAVVKEPVDRIPDIVAEMQRIYPYIDNSEKGYIGDARSAIKEVSDAAWDDILSCLLTDEVINHFAAAGKDARDEMVSFTQALGDIYYSTDDDELENTLRDFKTEFKDSFQILFGTGISVDDLYQLLMETKKQFPKVISKTSGYVDDLAFGTDDDLVNTIPEVMKDAIREAIKKNEFSEFRGKLSEIGWTADLLISERVKLSEEVDPDNAAELALGKAVVRSESALIDQDTNKSYKAQGEIINLAVGSELRSYRLEIMGKNATGLVDWVIVEDGDEFETRIDESNGEINHPVVTVIDNNGTLEITPNEPGEIELVAVRGVGGGSVDSNWILKITFVVTE